MQVVVEGSGLLDEETCTQASIMSGNYLLRSLFKQCNKCNVCVLGRHVAMVLLVTT